MNSQIEFRISSKMLCGWIVLFCIFSAADIGVEMLGTSSLVESLASTEEINLTTLQLVVLRGFKAVNHYVNTTDGYSLNVVRCTNPMINGGESGLESREIVLFVHGSALNANSFVSNSIGAHPIDYSKLDIKSKSQEELVEMFKKDPNKNSFPFLLLNLGHEVWLLNRRGTYQSQGSSDQNIPTTAKDQKPLGDSKTLSKRSLIPTLPDSLSVIGRGFTETLKVNPLVTNFINTAKTSLISLPRTFDSKYWNFTLDQEILIDLPQVIDYMLGVTKRGKIALVGHSTGGGLIVEVLSAIPELNDKVSAVFSWGPVIYPKSFRDDLIDIIAGPIFDLYVGPVFATFFVPLIHNFLAILCETPVSQATLCGAVVDAITGFSGGQLNLLPGVFTPVIDAFSSPSLVQVTQAIERGKLHHFDYQSTSRNMIAYGTPTPPLYNVSKITNTKLTFWGGNTDGIVPIDNIKGVIGDLTVEPAQVVYIDKPGVFFNHFAFLVHKDVGNLLNIPCLKTLYTLSD